MISKSINSSYNSTSQRGLKPSGIALLMVRIHFLVCVLTISNFDWKPYLVRLRYYLCKCRSQSNLCILQIQRS